MRCCFVVVVVVVLFVVLFVMCCCCSKIQKGELPIRECNGQKDSSHRAERDEVR